MKDELEYVASLKYSLKQLKEKRDKLQNDYVWFLGDGSIQGEKKAEQILKEIEEIDKEIEKVEGELLGTAIYFI